LVVTGPLSHYFYQLMEGWLPPTEPLCVVKRLLLDRLLFAPGFLLVFYFVMNVLEVGRPPRHRIQGAFQQFDQVDVIGRDINKYI